VTHVLAIDQGTSGTKAIVVDEAGQVISIAEIALRPDYRPGGGVEQDPEALYASVVDAGRRALDQAGVTVSAVALATRARPSWPGTGAPAFRSPRPSSGRTAAQSPSARRSPAPPTPWPPRPGWSWIRISRHRRWRGSGRT